MAINPEGASGPGEEAARQAPGTVTAATTRAAADTRTPEATGAAGTPGHTDKGPPGAIAGIQKADRDLRRHGVPPQ